MKCTSGEKDKGGRAAKRVFLKLGKVEVTRPDSLNWAVETNDADRVTYHTTLPNAIRRAVEAAAESRSNDGKEWLENYAALVNSLDRRLAHAFKNWTAAEGV